MPRLTNKQYLARRAFLAKIWQSAFIMLDPGQQQALHAYYQPTKDWTNEEALAHRQAVTKRRPSLPAQTGKYFNQLCDWMDDAAEQAAKQPATSPVPQVRVPAGKRGPLRVRSLMKPEPDARLVAFALIDFVKEQQKLEVEEHQTGEAA
jgi:hypothetical protein